MFYKKLKVIQLINCGYSYPSQWDLIAVDLNGYSYTLSARYRSHRFYVAIDETNNPDFNTAVKNQPAYQYLIHTFLPQMKEESTMTVRELKKYSKHILKW